MTWVILDKSFWIFLRFFSIFTSSQMLPKQLKDSQRHQRQPKQVELFLQSTGSLSSFCSQVVTKWNASLNCCFLLWKWPIETWNKTVNLWKLHEEIGERGPSRTNSRDSLFGEWIIKDQPELSASFYAERNPVDQAPPHPFQPFSLDKFQPPSSLELPTNPVGPITMTSYLNPAPQNSAHVKEYGLNKPMLFSGNQMK